MLQRKLEAIWITCALALAGCTPKPVDPNPPTEPLKVGFVYVGPIGDYGWSKAHEDGRQYLENFAENVKTTYVEAVLPPDSPKAVDDLVAAGYNVVFTTSFDFLAFAKTSLDKHPDLKILNCAGFKTGERLGTYQARVEEAEYLSGIVAGRMTKTNKIGVVAAVRIYEQMMHINAFALGVRSVNPNAKIFVRWVGNWFNPDYETKAVPDLVNDKGVDIIKGFTDTFIPLKEADKLGVYSVAHANKDGCAKAPNTCLVAAYYNWGPLYKKLVEELQAGTYPNPGRSDYVSMADLDVSGISPYNPLVPQAVRDEVQARQEKLVNRTLNVFQGPYKFSDGTMVAEGQTLTDDQLTCTSKFVEWVETFDGPACPNGQSDCGDKLTCTSGQCVAPDYSGCPK